MLFASAVLGNERIAIEMASQKRKTNTGGIECLNGNAMAPMSSPNPVFTNKGPMPMDVLPDCRRFFVDDKSGGIAEAEIAYLKHLCAGERAEKLVGEFMNDDAGECQPGNDESRNHRQRVGLRMEFT